MSNLHRAVAFIEEATEEISGLHYQLEKRRVELHQLQRRLEREQARTRDLEDEIASYELQTSKANKRADSAVKATLDHAARAASGTHYPELT